MIACGKKKNGILEIWKQSLSETHNKAQSLPERKGWGNGLDRGVGAWTVPEVKGVGGWGGNGREGESDEGEGRAAGTRAKAAAAGRAARRDKEEIVQSISRAAPQSSDLICFQEQFGLFIELLCLKQGGCNGGALAPAVSHALASDINGLSRWPLEYESISADIG